MDYDPNISYLTPPQFVFFLLMSFLPSYLVNIHCLSSFLHTLSLITWLCCSFVLYGSARVFLNMLTEHVPYTVINSSASRNCCLQKIQGGFTRCHSQLNKDRLTACGLVILNRSFGVSDASSIFVRCTFFLCLTRIFLIYTQ